MKDFIETWRGAMVVIIAYQTCEAGSLAEIVVTQRVMLSHLCVKGGGLFKCRHVPCLLRFNKLLRN